MPAAGAEHGCQRHGTFRVFHHAGADRCGFHADKRPQAQQDTLDDRMAVGGAGGIPVSLIGGDVKPVPADGGSHDHRISTSTVPVVVKRLTRVPPSMFTKVKTHTIAIQAMPAGTGLFRAGKKVER